MGRSKVKYWKTVKGGLDLQTALNMYRTQEIEGHRYDYLSIKLGYQIFEPGYLSKYEKFTIDEALSNNWELVVPDDAAEEKTNKLRQMLKDKNFTGLRYDKIDNMSIEEIFNEILNIMNNLDKDNKYRIAKHIIENELYKKI